MKKKIVALTLVGTVLLSSGSYAAIVEKTPTSLKNGEVSITQAFAPNNKEYNIIVNDVDLKLPEDTKNAFYGSQNNIMVPLRAVAEALGYDVVWNGETGSIELFYENHWTRLYIGKNEYLYGSVGPFQLGQAPEAINQRTYVPLEFFKVVLRAQASVEGTTIKFQYPSEETTPNIFYEFSKDLQGFESGFVDLPVYADTKDLYELDFHYKEIPVKDDKSKGIYLTGHNRSDDLFMYVYKNLGKDHDLKPNTKYLMDLSFKVATNVPEGMMGIGGSPGEAVYVKAGVVNKKPISVVDLNKYYRLYLDKGNQSSGGKDLSVIGNIVKDNGTSDDSYAYKHFETTSLVEVDSEGNAYVVIGFDSGYEGKTEVYLDDITVNLIEIPDNN